MEAGDFFFGRRIRQNHALEHATVTILTRRLPDLRLSARSSSRGFIIFAEMDPTVVRTAAAEALDRLKRGEAELAIHPNCGTNLAVGASVAMIGAVLALNAVRPRMRVVSAAASTIAGIALARPLGKIVQQYVTTLPDLHDVRITEVQNRTRLRIRTVEVGTALQ
jgi:Domain of unknown function (DUF6391)